MNRKIVGLKYINAYSLDSLETSVNIVILAGWEPFGIVVLMTHDLSREYIQAMVKYKPAPVDISAQPQSFTPQNALRCPQDEPANPQGIRTVPWP